MPMLPLNLAENDEPQIYLNTSQIIAVEPHDSGSHITTTGYTDTGPLDYIVAQKVKFVIESIQNLELR